jgi:hypothetical protein
LLNPHARTDHCIANGSAYLLNSPDGHVLFKAAGSVQAVPLDAVQSISRQNAFIRAQAAYESLSTAIAEEVVPVKIDVDKQRPKIDGAGLEKKPKMGGAAGSKGSSQKRSK